MRRSHRLAPALILTALAAWAVGCGPPPAWSQPSPLPQPPSQPAVASSTPSPTQSPTHSPSPRPSSPRFGELVALPCDQTPGPAEIIAVLRRAGLMPDRATATVVNGPLCAGDWQYAVVSVPGRDPLQVVTEGRPGALTLVTAGTEICVAQVRINAPLGIRTAAGCVG